MRLQLHFAGTPTIQQKNQHLNFVKYLFLRHRNSNDKKLNRYITNTNLINKSYKYSKLFYGGSSLRKTFFREKKQFDRINTRLNNLYLYGFFEKAQ